MQIKFTLTTEMPTYCIGLWDTRQQAEEFVLAGGLASEGLVVTPVFYAGQDDVEAAAAGLSRSDA